jgi:ankyrin repeat protein
MKVKRIVLYPLLFVCNGVFTISGMQTPERPKRPRYAESPITPPSSKRRRVCPSSVQRDRNFSLTNRLCNEQELSEPRIAEINEGTVDRWPSLWNAAGNTDWFIKRLAGLAKKRGTTLLHTAALKNKVQCMADLIIYGEADLTAKAAKDKDTPLHLWAMASYDCSAADAMTVSNAILESLRRTKSTFPDASLLKNDQGSSPLHVACSSNLRNPFAVKALLDVGHPLAVYNDQDESILHYLAARDEDDDSLAKIISLLDKCTLSPELLNHHSHSLEETALHRAIKQKNLLLFNFLVTRSGIDLNVRDILDQTPLHVAAIGCLFHPTDSVAKSMYAKLIELGANQRLRDVSGNTAKQLLK